MTIQDNLKTLIDLVENEPEHLIDLAFYECGSACGTLHCTLGLAAASGKFPFGVKDGTLTSVLGDDFSTKSLDPLFGPKAYSNLFATAGVGLRDKKFPYIGDKALALARLRAQLESLS
jgi:hypothetical protein